MSEPNTIRINEVDYIRKDQVTNSDIVKDYVIVRTYSAGVFAGNLVSRNGQEVVLKNARRLWAWYGAATLSQLAMEGVSKPKDCKFPQEVTEITLLQAIEIIPCTDKAIKSIKGVDIWKN
jgi:hypothetical protein